MDELGRVGVVVNINHSTLPFREAQRGSRKLPVIDRGRYDVVRCELDLPGCNAQRVVGLLGRDFTRSPRESRHST